VQLLREDRAAETEFVTISYWESVEAMSRFAGTDPGRIHHLERDAEFLVELPSGVQILNIVSTFGKTGSDLGRGWECDSVLTRLEAKSSVGRWSRCVVVTRSRHRLLPR
jgi:hypothetical protein